MILKLTILFSILLHWSAPVKKDGCNMAELADKIAKIEEMPYIPELSGDSIYWSIIVDKLNSVPCLIELLDDKTPTASIVPNFGGNYTISDISFLAINEIIRGIPLNQLILGFSKSNGFHDYWSYVRGKKSNRRQLKSKLNKWFLANRDNLKWVKDEKKYGAAKNWKFPHNTHPSGGYYIVDSVNEDPYEDFYITPQNDSVFTKSFTVHNNSNENMYVWFDSKSSGNSIEDAKRYFYPRMGDISLLEILNDESVNNKKLNIIGQTFVKLIEPEKQFRITIISNHADNYHDETLKEKLVKVQSSQLNTAIKNALGSNKEYCFNSDIIVIEYKDLMNL